MTLEELRGELDGLDRQLVELVARRQEIIHSIAEVKRATNFPLRDYRREREVFLRARVNAEKAGVSADVAEEMLRVLVRYSLTQQEKATKLAHNAGTGRSALVIGGAGKMGNWFAQFLYTQGFDVEIADPRAAPGETVIADWRSSALNYDFIVVATPLGKTDAVLHELAERKPRSVVFDLGSLKSPLRTGLKKLQDAGVRTTSIHPMFGPDAELLSNRHVVLIDLGDAQALASARALFAPTMAELVVMTLDEHDRFMSYVLGLSHAVNIAFFTALRESHEAAPRLLELSSTTFDAQFNISRRVAQEDPQLYFEIQHLNSRGGESLAALAAAVETIRKTVAAGDAEGFHELMRKGRDYTENRRKDPQRG
jgi:chorismate mutase / prephenate dehydrogenase